MAVKKKLTAKQDKCSGCMICQQLCSFIYCGSYNPLEAYILVRPSFDSKAFELTVDERCTGCGVCAIYCNYGALEMEEI